MLPCQQAGNLRQYRAKHPFLSLPRGCFGGPSWGLISASRPKAGVEHFARHLFCKNERFVETKRSFCKGTGVVVNQQSAFRLDETHVSDRCRSQLSSVFVQYYSTTAVLQYYSTTILQYSSAVLEYYSTAAQLQHNCSTTAAQLQYYSTTVLQYNCATAVLQYYSTTVLGCYSTTVLQYRSATALQNYRTTVPQYNCTTAVLQYCSIAVLQYCSTTVLVQYYSTIVL